MKRALGYINPQPIIIPQVSTAAVVGNRISLANYDSCLFVMMGSDATTGDAAFSLQQHTAGSGGTSKELAPRVYYRKTAAGEVTPAGDYSEVAPATHDSVANAVEVAAVSGQIIAVEVTADELDVAGGFTHVSANVSLGSAAKIVSVAAILSGARYAVDPTAFPAVD